MRKTELHFARGMEIPFTAQNTQKNKNTEGAHKNTLTETSLNFNTYNSFPLQPESDPLTYGKGPVRLPGTKNTAYTNH